MCIENEILLQYSHVHLFAYCLWLLLSYNSESSNCDIKACSVYYLILYRKSSLTSDVEKYPLLVVLKPIESFSFGRLWMAEEWSSWSLKVPPSLPSSFILNSSQFELLHMNACDYLFFLMYFFPLGVYSYLSTLYLQHQLFHGKQTEFLVFSRHILWLSSMLDSPTTHFSLLLHPGCWLLLEKFTQLGQLTTIAFMVSHLC